MNPKFELLIKTVTNGMLERISDMFSEPELVKAVEMLNLPEPEFQDFWEDLTASLEARISEIRGMS